MSERIQGQGGAVCRVPIDDEDGVDCGKPLPCPEHGDPRPAQGQGGATHTPRESAIGFLVRFENVGAKRLNWEERIERPVSNDKIVKAVKRKKALLSRGVDAESTSDYGGVITAGWHTVGSYFIVPDSEGR